MRSDNKLACCGSTSVWFDDVGISPFHSCVVVDLWQSLSEWLLLQSECVLVCHCKNVRTNIKVLVKLGKSGSETREMLVQVYRDNAMNRTAVYKWVTRSSEGKESVTDEERSGRPAMSRTEENIAKVCQTVCENRRLTVRSIAEQANIDREMVKKILIEDLDMRKVCAKIVLKDLLTRHCL
jgi:hypothetical protein